MKNFTLKNIESEKFTETFNVQLKHRNNNKKPFRQTVKQTYPQI